MHVIGGLVLGAGLLTLATGCDGPPPKPPMFNNRIALATAKWNAAILAFKSTVDPLSKGTDISPAAAQQAYDTLAKELKEFKRGSRHMPVPPGSSKGQAYLSSYQDYVDVEADLMENEMKRIVTTIGDTKLNPAQKWQVIYTKIYGDIEKKEKPAREKLQSAQNEFASAHKLQITATPGK
jgi:hypothetical protein